MKKLFSIALCLILLLGLAACKQETPGQSTGPAQPSQPLQVGYSRKVITPEIGTPLGGNNGDPMTKVASNIWDDLYAACIAFTDGEGNTILLYHLDLCTCTSYVPVARKAIAEKTGLPFDNIMVSCTHNHAAPAMDYEHDKNNAYKKMVQEQMIAAAQEALADRKPAEMYTAEARPKNLNFNRHYIMNDGSVSGDWFGSTDSGYAGHVEEADNQMQLICFKRQGGKDVVLVNWQAHPHASGVNHTNVTSDVVGAFRSYVEAELDCHFAYFAGASGNVNSKSRISSENISTSYSRIGALLGQHAVTALDNLTRKETGRVQTLFRELPISRGGKELPAEAYAFSVGDVAFVTVPYEMFNANGMFVKANSPFETTFVVTCANNHYRYIASDATYEYGGYEIGVANYDRGSGEKLADGYVAMLKEIYPTRLFAGGVNPVGLTVPESPLYWNMDPDAHRKLGSDGTYTVDFLKDGQIVTLKVSDKVLMNHIDNQVAMGLTLEGDKVTGVIHMTDMPYERLCQKYFVESVSGDTVKVCLTDSGKGETLEIKMPSSAKVYDLSDLARTPGELTKIQKKDIVTVIADEKGTPVYAFVTDRVASAELDPAMRYCQHCKKHVVWYKWLDTGSVPLEAGHYYLTDNVTVTETGILEAGDLCLDLNGKTVKQETSGQRIYSIETDGIFNIMDSVGGGSMVASTADTDSANKSALIIYLDVAGRTINLYSGTLDASESTAQYATAVDVNQGVLNMYGGTIKGGKAYGSGSGALAVDVGAVFNLYDGTVEGGYNCLTDFNSSIRGGGIIRAGGEVNIYGGVMKNGKSDFDGGGIYLKSGATLKLLGGTLSGSEASGKGGFVYAEAGASLTVGGNVQLVDNQGSNIYLAGCKLNLDAEGLKGAKIGVSADTDGVFLEGTFTDADAACFVSDDPGKTVVLTQEGIALVTKPAA